MKRPASNKWWLAVTGAALFSLSAACSSASSTPTPAPSPTPSFMLETPLADDVLIENVRDFLSGPLNTFDVPVDAEGDGRLAHSCLEVIEGGLDGFEWSVEQREDGQTVVMVHTSASLLERDTGTWLAIPGGGVGTTSDSISCNAVQYEADRRDNP